MLPVIAALLFWAIYFWDIGRKRIKLLEAVRFAAWETAAYRGAFGKGPTQIADDTKARYADLDGSTPTGTPSENRVNFNKLTVEASVTRSDSVADVDSGASGGMAAVQSAIGSGLRPIFTSLVGGARLNTKVRAQITYSVQNDILPGRLTTEMEDPLEFKAETVLLYDTWAAWKPADNPANSAGIVKQRIKNALISANGIVAFPGLGAVLGNGSALGSVAGQVLGFLGLPWFFNIMDHHVQVVPRTLGNDITSSAAVSPTSAGMPGRLHENRYWTGNGVGVSGGSTSRHYSDLLNDPNAQYRAMLNRHYRAEVCRGDWYDGSRTAEAEFYAYLIQGDACAESGQKPYDSDADGTRRGLRYTGTPGFQIEPR